MGTQSWKTLPAVVSAVAALAAVVLVVAATVGDAAWSAVIATAGVAVLSAVLALLVGTDGDQEGSPLLEGRHQ
jgi:hypothetical protein